jgi:TatD DNase family protein
MFYDIHCHLTEEVFEPDRRRILAECAKKRICLVLNGVDFKDNLAVLQLAEDNKGVFACLGMHPNLPFDSRVIAQIRENKDRIVGIGEIGLDFKSGFSKEQVSGFKKMLNLAEEIGKPVIIHSRQAEKEVLELVKELKVPVVLHAFFGRMTLIR